MRVLVTGTSSGIGRQAVHQLAAKGCDVIATARDVADIADLASDRVVIEPLDVTHGSSIRKVVDRVARLGGIDALVNNAGHGMFLPVEETPIEQLRAMYEVNLFGLHHLTQSILPSMREQGHGRIVNVSSVAGHIGFPMIGHYSGSKFALRAVSQALRAELRPFGIHVALVEPGSVRTAFGLRAREEQLAAGHGQHGVGPGKQGAGPGQQAAGKGMQGARPEQPAAQDQDATFQEQPAASATRAYRGLHDRFDALVEAKKRAGPDIAAKQIVKACIARRPRFRYVAGWDARFSIMASRLLPDAAVNMALARAFRP